MRVRLLIAAILTVAACQTATNRQPVEEARVEPAFNEVAPTDIVVAAILAPESSGLANEAFPAAEMREALRRYLIDHKNYATPSSEWVDDLAVSGGTNLDTDAVLRVRVDQWDAQYLDRRGVIYAGAEFRLTSPDGAKTLWTYTCRDRQIPVRGPHGESGRENNFRDAAIRLSEDALSRLPRK